MTYYSFIKKNIALALCCMSLSSCLKEPLGNIKSEVEITNGSINYFTNDMDFGFEGGAKQMSFKINVKWDMKIASTQNGAQWLTIEPAMGNSGSNKVTFVAQENPTYEDRSVMVRFSAGDTIRNIKVNQKRLEAITLTSDVYQFSPIGGTVNIEVNHSKDYDYTIPEDYKSWIHPSSSKTRGLLDKSIVSFTIDPTNEYENREGKIYFTAGGEEEVVTIYQTGEGKLILSQNEYNLSEAEQEFTVDVNSNFDFSVQMPDVEWLKESKSQTRGMSSHTLKFKVAYNDDYKARSAKIKLYDKNSSLSEEIVVNQASIGAVITAEQKSYQVNSASQDLDIDIKSNFDYTADFQGANWIKQRRNNTRGITSRLLRLSINENKSTDSRSADIKLYDRNSSASMVITIIQDAKKTIEIPTKEYTIDELGGTMTIKVNANTGYQLTPNNNWIKVDAQTRGLTTNEHRITIDPLGDSGDRDGTITISNEDMKYSATITIKQRNTFYFEAKNMDILLGKEKTLSLKNSTKQSVDWSSSNNKIATVTNTGFVKGISRGTAKIIAKTADGKHIATCIVKICEITDMMAIKSGGTIHQEGNVAKQGSQIKWAIKNNSPVKVTLKSMQLIGNSDNEISNEIYVNEEIAAGSTVTKSTTIEAPNGYHLPVTCLFIFEYNNQEYHINAKYE